MSRWVVTRAVSFRPREYWGTLPGAVRKFLLHPGEVVVDYMTVSLSGRYPKPPLPGLGGWFLDVSLRQLVDGRMKRLNLGESEKTFVRTDEPFTKESAFFDVVVPDAPLFVMFQPNNFLDPTTVPLDFEIHVTVDLVVDPSL